MDVSRDEGDSKVIVRHLSEGKKDVEAEDYHRESALGGGRGKLVRQLRPAVD